MAINDVKHFKLMKPYYKEIILAFNKRFDDILKAGPDFVLKTVMNDFTPSVVEFLVFAFRNSKIYDISIIKNAVNILQNNFEQSISSDNVIDFIKFARKCFDGAEIESIIDGMLSFFKTKYPLAFEKIVREL